MTTTTQHSAQVSVFDLCGVLLVRVPGDLPGVVGEVQVLAGRVVTCLSCGVQEDRHTEALELELAVISEGLVHPVATTRRAALAVLRGLQVNRSATTRFTGPKSQEFGVRS